MLEQRGVLVYLVIGTVLSGSTLSTAQICYVDVNATEGANNGSSWEDAYTSLMFATTACIGQTEIRVADGLYRPDNCAGFSCTRSSEFVVYLPIYGGYAGLSAPNAPRNPQAYVTIISGDIEGDDADCTLPPVPSIPLPEYCRLDNLYTVVRLNLPHKLDGVTVQGGFDWAPPPSVNDGFGGGVRAYGSDPEVGVWSEIRGCTIRDNYAGGCGGGVFAASADLMIVNSNIESNFSGGNGGGIDVEGASELWVYNSSILNNMARDGGGGILLQMPVFQVPLEGRVVNCLIAGNSADFPGGSSSGGGGIYVEGNSTRVTITNSTIVGNFSDAGGGGMLVEHTVFPANAVQLQNSIVRDNLGTGAKQLAIQSGPAGPLNLLDVLYSNVTTALDPDVTEIAGLVDFVVGNIEDEPDFVDADGSDDDPATVADNDYRLLGGSPGIDGGSSVLVPMDIPDLDGDDSTSERLPFALFGRRFFDDPQTTDAGVADLPAYPEVVDMGAYEFQEYYSPVIPLAPHDWLKNRYISFVPNNGINVIAFRVSKSTWPEGTCWVQSPVQSGPDQFTAKCDSTPVYRAWTEPVVHVGDCEIIPVAQYSIAPFAEGVAVAHGLDTQTIMEPVLNHKKWGDLVGHSDGSVWTPPNGFTNVSDVLAILAFISGWANRPHFTAANLQAISSPDSCLNNVVNTADLLICNQALRGDRYTATSKTNAPAYCPPCPCGQPGNPCMEFGACCAAYEVCWDGMTEPQCANIQGIWHGNVMCDVDTCITQLVDSGLDVDSFDSILTPTFDLSVTPYQIDAEETATVSVYLDAAEVVGGYEVSLDVTGGTTGTLTRESITINTNHNNFLFAGHGTYLATNVVSNMAGAVEASGAGVLASSDEYLATYTFLASSDAEGVFEVRVSDERSFILDEEGNQMAHDASVVAYVRVGVECMSAAHCDDGNQCTSDVCISGACVNTNLTSGTACDDGLYCTLTDTCNGSGVCVGSAAKPCSKPNPVCCEATDSCHPSGYECELES